MTAAGPLRMREISGIGVAQGEALLLQQPAGIHQACCQLAPGSQRPHGWPGANVRGGATNLWMPFRPPQDSWAAGVPRRAAAAPPLHRRGAPPHASIPPASPRPWNVRSRSGPRPAVARQLRSHASCGLHRPRFPRSAASPCRGDRPASSAQPAPGPATRSRSCHTGRVQTASASAGVMWPQRSREPCRPGMCAVERDEAQRQIRLADAGHALDGADAATPWRRPAARPIPAARARAAPAPASRPMNTPLRRNLPDRSPTALLFGSTVDLPPRGVPVQAAVGCLPIDRAGAEPMPALRPAEELDVVPERLAVVVQPRSII